MLRYDFCAYVAFCDFCFLLHFHLQNLYHYFTYRRLKNKYYFLKYSIFFKVKNRNKIERQQNQVNAESAVWSVRIWGFSLDGLGPNASPSTHQAALGTSLLFGGPVSFSVNQGDTHLSRGDCEVGSSTGT